MNSAKPMPQNKVVQLQQELYNGPIPHPDILRGFGAVDPSFPERIMKMAEEHAKTEDEIRLASVKANAASMSRGQWLSFLLCLGALGACILLAYWRMGWPAIITGVAAIVQGAASGINRKNND